MSLRRRDRASSQDPQVVPGLADEASANHEENVIASRHYEPMAETVAPLPRRRRIELPMLEARNRFTQLVRLASLTGQVTVVTDQGRPAAAILPAGAALIDEPSAAPNTHTGSAVAGWMRRIEQVREAVRRQHATRISELEHALSDAWNVIDRVAPRGSDRAADELRVAQRDVLAKPPPAAGSPARSS
jgi:prevent-host-death family protein